MGIIALDLGIRGAAAGLFLMIMVVILARARPLTTIKLVALVLALSAAVQTVRTWSADLVAGRRRLRLVIVTSSLAFLGLLAVSDLVSTPATVPGIFGSLPSAIGLLAMAALVGWSLF